LQQWRTWRTLAIWYDGGFEFWRTAMSKHDVQCLWKWARNWAKARCGWRSRTACICRSERQCLHALDLADGQRRAGPCRTISAG
jgi:hypothetical protein